MAVSKLLQETGDALLLETGDAFLLNPQPFPLFGMPGNISLSHGQADQLVPIFMVKFDDCATYVLDVTAPLVEVSKNGVDWVTANDGTWAELDHGLYTVTLDATDTNTLGWLAMRVRATTATSITIVLANVSVNPSEQRSSYNRLRAISRGRT